MLNNSANESNIVSDSDQLITILSVIGPQDESNKSFITETPAIDYVNSLQQSITNHQNIDKKCEGINPAIIKLLKELLEFNPHFRSSSL